MSDADNTTENMEETPPIIQGIEIRWLSAGEQTNGYFGALNEQSKKRIHKFLEWVGRQNECGLSTIKPRPRKHKLFGKSNFKAENLYSELFDDIQKELNSGVTCPLKFDITLNEDITNQYLIEEANELIVSEKMPEDATYYRYGVVMLGDMPVLYLLYIDPAKDLDFVD